MPSLLQPSLRTALVALCAITSATLLAQTWDGSAGNSNWSTGGNWTGGLPANNGTASVVFAGSAGTSPNLTSNWSIASLSFASGASAFTLGSAGSYTLAIGSGGITNNSSSTQTIAHALTLNSGQTWNASSGNLSISGNINPNYQALTITGSANTTISGSITGTDTWSDLTKTGSGTLTLSGNNTALRGRLLVNTGSVVLASSGALGGVTTGNAVASGASLHLTNNITVTEDNFDLSGSGVSGSGALRNVSGNNTLNARVTLAADATIVSAAGQLTLGQQVQLQGRTLTLDGAGSIVSSQQIANSGGLIVSGSGSRTFNGQVTVTTGLLVNGSGSVVFNQNVTGGGPVTLAGTGSTTLGGSELVASTLSIQSGTNTIAGQISANSISVTGGVNQLNGAITATNFTQSAGTTTFGGPNAQNISNFTVTGGSLVFDKTNDSFLHSSNISISGATVSLLGDGQIFEWDNVTLGNGAVLQLNDTTQTIENLTITGNAVIDFGTGGSTFDINNLTLTGNSVLTIVNWADDLDTFFAQYDPGSSTLAKIIFEGLGEAAWTPGSGSGVLVPTSPVPEPAATGFLMLGGLAVLPFLRRSRRRVAPDGVSVRKDS